MMKYKFCMVGNFISTYGHTPQMCENLYEKFSHEGHQIIKAGIFFNPFLRLLHMLFSIYAYRNNYYFLTIETFSGKAFLWAYLSSLVARFLNKPYIVVLRGGNLPGFSLKHQRFMQNYLRSSKAIISPSMYLNQWCANSQQPCRIIENPIETKYYSKRQRKIFLPKLLWIRRFHSIYNPQMAIETLNIIIRHYPDSTLTMAGPDSGELETCKKLAKKYNLIHAISFPGLVDKQQINQLGQAHDIFINTSNIDNTPYTLIEAAAMGLPIISTNPGGIPFLFKEEKQILLVNENDSLLMANKIISTIESPARAIQRIDSAYQTINKFEWNHVKSKWENLFSELK